MFGCNRSVLIQTKNEQQLFNTTTAHRWSVSSERPSHPDLYGAVLTARYPAACDLIPHDARDLGEVTLKRVEERHLVTFRREAPDVDHAVGAGVGELSSAAMQNIYVTSYYVVGPCEWMTNFLGE